jgi:hypothetical protein
MKINPIETRYAGCRFRSRLEARWAVFFDKLDIKWEYEPQGYVVNGQPYLPDFLLPKLSVSVEVKGEASRLDLNLLANAMGEHWRMTLILGAIPTMPKRGVPTHGMLVPARDVREPKTATVTLSRAIFVPTADSAMVLPVSLSQRPDPEAAIGPRDLWIVRDFPRVTTAYAAARSARFEHGESG